MRKGILTLYALNSDTSGNLELRYTKLITINNRKIVISHNSSLTADISLELFNEQLYTNSVIKKLITILG